MYPVHTNGEPDPAFEPAAYEAAQKAAQKAEQAEPPTPEQEAPETDEVDVSEYHVGGGMYELPNGERVRGKDAAREALES